jgi:hypothetical protein
MGPFMLIDPLRPFSRRFSSACVSALFTDIGITQCRRRDAAMRDASMRDTPMRWPIGWPL